MSAEAAAYHFFPVASAMVEWGAGASVAAIGDAAVMASQVTFAPPFLRGPAGPAGKVLAITLAEIGALATAGMLVSAVIYNVTDAGFLAVPLTSSTYRRFYAIHVGPTAPDDLFAIWFDTSGI